MSVRRRASMVVALALTASTLAPTAPAIGQEPSPHRWFGPDGNALPFANDDELLEFMRTASVVDEKPIGTGINHSVRLTLEQNGVRARAVFREVDHRERMATIDRVTYQLFADSYLFEPAAYELSKLIGLPHVPPAALRTIRGRDGSVQIWVEDAIDEEGPDFRPPSPLAWSEQISDMYFFDNLVYNIDRNPGNVIVTSDYRLWLIDHTRAFQFKNRLLDDKVLRVRRSSYEKLMALSEEQIRETLRPFLKPAEVGSLLERRKALEQHVEEIFVERGDGVFY